MTYQRLTYSKYWNQVRGAGGYMLCELENNTTAHQSRICCCVSSLLEKERCGKSTTGIHIRVPKEKV